MAVNDKEQEKTPLVICKGDIVRATEKINLEGESYLAISYNHVAENSPYGAIFKPLSDEESKKAAKAVGVRFELGSVSEGSVVLDKKEETFGEKIIVALECRRAEDGFEYATVFERPVSMRGIAKECFLQCTLECAKAKLKGQGMHKIVNALIKMMRDKG